MYHLILIHFIDATKYIACIIDEGAGHFLTHFNVIFLLFKILFREEKSLLDHFVFSLKSIVFIQKGVKTANRLVKMNLKIPKP